MILRKIFLVLIYSLFFFSVTISVEAQKGVGDLSAPIGCKAGDELVYKSSMDYGSKHFSALYIIKCFSSEHFRVVLMTEMGVKLLDLEYESGDFLLHYVMPELNRKVVIKGIQDDFRILFDKPKYRKMRKYGTGYKVRSGGLRYYLNANGHYEKIVKRRFFVSLKFFELAYEEKEMTLHTLSSAVPAINLQQSMKRIKQ